MFPNSIIPVGVEKHQEAVEDLLKEMIEQVLKLHSTAKTIHIGCDEVWCLGQSDLTRQYMEASGKDVTDVFLEHCAFVASTAKKIKADLQILIWDDMIRMTSSDKLIKFNLNNLVKPVIWSYGRALFFPPGMLEKYKSVWGEDSIWAGSAWRGATGSNMHATNIRYHLDNHLAWLSVLKELPHLSGIILTGWSRYDHYATLCELFPVSLPSLHCCLTVLLRREWSSVIHKQCSIKLGLKDDLMLEPYMHLTGEDVEHPTFPGGQIYSMIITYIRLESQYNTIMSSSAKLTWLNEWQIKKGFLNPLQIQVTLSELSIVRDRLKELSNNLENELSNLVHDFTAEEWIETNIIPKIREIDRLVLEVEQKIC